MTNRFYIMPNPNPHSNLFDIVVEDADTVRKNKNETFMIVKLHEGDERNHSIFNGFTEYTRAEILTEIRSNPDEWGSEEI